MSTLPLILRVGLACTAGPGGIGDDSGQSTDAGGTAVTDGGGALPTCTPDQGELEHLFTSTEPTWAAIAAGSQHACGLRADTGGTECWGYDWDGRATVPELPDGVTAIVAGSTFSCALLADGQPSCWGEAGPVITDHPAGPFDQLHAGYDYVCGLSPTGDATCWGDNEHGQLVVEGGPFVSLSAGRSHACGLAADGSATCWGGVDAPGAAPPPHDGEVVDYGQADVPEGSWLSLAAGDFHTCAITLEGQARCWGRDRAGELTPPADVVFTDLAAGGAHSCGVSQDGAMCCWGADSPSWSYNQLWQPPGPFTEVVAATVYTCGLRQASGGSGLGQELLCWGALGDLPVRVP